jgi:hypothetical protein
MSALFVILSFIGLIAVLVARALAVDEIKGRIRLRTEASLEATITALPDQLQAEYAEEWRAELAVVITMPLTAAQFARGVRASARQLVADPALAPAGVDGQTSGRGRLQADAVGRAQRTLRDVRRRTTRVVASLQASSLTRLERAANSIFVPAANLLALVSAIVGVVAAVARAVTGTGTVVVVAAGLAAAAATATAAAAATATAAAALRRRR